MSNIIIPWEQSCVKQIFDEELLPKRDLQHDLACRPIADQMKLDDVQPSAFSLGQHPSLQPVFEKCGQSIREHTFMESEMRVEKDMQAAVVKWSIIIRSNSKASAIGLQIEQDPLNDLRTIRASMGVKSPNTVLSRANAMLAYMRWHTIEHPLVDFLPMREEHAWAYIAFLSQDNAPPSRSQSFVHTCRFAYHIIGFHGALDVVSSRRNIHLSEIQLSEKVPSKQARPLTVYELQQLHQIASDHNRHVKDRVLASHLLLMGYSRCRHSDTLQIEDVQHDHSGNLEYIQLRTRF